MSKVLCIYHGGCDDGFAAAWAVRRALGADVEFYEGVYQTPPPDCADRDVMLVDFSYKRPVLEEIARVAKSLLILDHHKTAAEDLAGFMTPPHWGIWHQAAIGGRLSISLRAAELFDMDRSGAGITWDYLRAGAPRPELINLVEDRDLWRFHYPQTKAFSAALRSYPQDFDVWDKLAENVPALVGEGFAIQRFYDQKIAEARKFAYRHRIKGRDVLVCNAPYFMASDLAGELAAGEPFAATYYQTADNISVSLRSRAPDGVDVSEIAKAFGGGGHKHAAGFRVHRLADTDT